MQKKVDDKKPKYKLTYFNIRGRGELPRIIFAAANQPFEDKRVEFIDWPNLKPKTPHGYLPILSMEEGGNVFELDQSQTIVRFLSKRFGLHGQNDMEAAIIEADLDLCYGLFLEVERISKADPGDMKKVLENLKQPFETFVKDMECKLSKKDSKGYLELQKLTTADLALYGIVTMFKCNKLGVESKILDDHFQMVGEIEGIKEYVKNRPETLG